jgi:hypothetical protein
MNKSSGQSSQLEYQTKTPPNKSLKFRTDTTVKCSPLSTIENNLTKIGSLFNTKI